LCVIAKLSAGAMFPKTALYNAVYNNWHSWGLIIKDGNGRLEVKKGVESETDPALIEKLLEDNKDCERILHLRYCTKGDVTEGNAHPFEVYNSNKRQVYFMHNGTLAKYGPGYNYNRQGDEHIDSDSKEFAEKVLAPALLRWTGEQGKADYTDAEFFNLLIKPNWTDSSKGILISNDLTDHMWGPSHGGWHRYKIVGEPEDTPELWVSNSDYFSNVTRGPEKDRRDAEAKRIREEEEKNKAPFQGTEANKITTGAITGSITKKLNPSSLLRSPDLDAKLDTAFSDYDLVSDEGISFLAMITEDEWEDFVTRQEADVVAHIISKICDAHYRTQGALERMTGVADRRHIKLQELLSPLESVENAHESVEQAA